MSNPNYWPWWIGGVGLALVAVGFPVLNRAPLGVSGAMGRLVAFLAPGRAQGSDDEGSAPETAQGGATDCAAADGPPLGCDPIPRSGTGTDTVGNPASAGVRTPAWTGPVFLLSMLLGGSLAAWIGKTGFGGSGLSAGFRSLFGDGAGAVAALFLGGLLVGFGTRWSGGCTSGHGLSGVGRLQPASLAATGVFFGTAIAVSFLIERILR